MGESSPVLKAHGEMRPPRHIAPAVDLLLVGELKHVVERAPSPAESRLLHGRMTSELRIDSAPESDEGGALQKGMLVCNDKQRAKV